ncbi:MAG: secretion protein HlyD [Oscillatoriales cyanobacterium RU_3_3]|nr:secretion protein HlyD [Oscillatoriales cyanobacterium RU_3_3]
MLKKQQTSLFAELTDADSATVSGASNTSGTSGSTNSITTNNKGEEFKMLFVLPQSNPLYMYTPSRQRSYKTLVV